MIQLLIFRLSFILGAIGAFLIGLVIGHTWGNRTGYKAGLVASNRLSRDSLVFNDLSIHPDSTKMKRIQCSREFRISPDMTPEYIALIHRAEIHQLCENVAKELMKQEIIRPVIVDGDIRSVHDIRRVLTSFYIVLDPEFERYPTLWTPPPSDLYPNAPIS